MSEGGQRERRQRRAGGHEHVLAAVHHVGDRTGKIASKSVWIILDIKEGNRTQNLNQRMGEPKRSGVGRPPMRGYHGDE